MTTKRKIKRDTSKSRFGHIKRNYLRKKLSIFIMDNIDKNSMNILSPEDFSTIFVEEIKKLNESDALASQIENLLQTLIKNTVTNSVRIGKIPKNKNKTIDERESQNYLKEKDILSDNSTYGIDDIGLKLGKAELSVLPYITIHDEFELHLRKYNQSWRKFCTKISKFL